LAEAKTSFGQRLKQYGQWREKTNMDRFVTLVFLTAKEKAEFCKRMFGDEAVDYLDGDDVESVTLKPEDQQRSVPSGQFVTGVEEPVEGDG
jgi:hypothetical protein